MSAVTIPSRNVTRSEPVSRIFARSLQSIIPARVRTARTFNCPYCDGKVLFTRNEEHLDAKNCPHCGMRVERREWPEKLYDPMPILRTKPGGPDSMKIETPETKDEAAKKGEKEKKD